MDELGSTRSNVHDVGRLPGCVKRLIPQILRLAGQSKSSKARFPEETQGKENMHGYLAYWVSSAKPLEDSLRDVDKLREICAVVPVNPAFGNRRSGNA